MNWLAKLEAQSPSALGRAYALTSAMLQALLGYSTKSVVGADTMSVVFVRSIINVALGYAVAKHKNCSMWPVTDFDRDTHFYRMIIGGLGIIFFHSALGLAPLQVVVVVLSLNIPMNVLILHLLGKPSSLVIYAFIALDFFGIVLVINPALIGLAEPRYQSCRPLSSQLI